VGSLGLCRCTAVCSQRRQYVSTPPLLLLPAHLGPACHVLSISLCSQPIWGQDATCIHTSTHYTVGHLRLNTRRSAEKRYTLILKDTLLDKDPETGREQATISWECDFELPPQAEPGETLERQVYVPWSSLNPTYRGKLKKDARPIDLKNVKRFSIMMRR